MNNCHQSRQHDRKEEKAPYSRIFIVCDKQLRESDLIAEFEHFGTIEDVHMPRDRNTGESKGVVYIKYSKTSAAALAIQAMHLRTLKDNTKPIKVMVASYKNEIVTTTSDNKYTRLFIKVSQDATHLQVREHFETFGDVKSVFFLKDKVADSRNKGFAYVLYETFLEAATAFEECDRKYKPIFACPRDEIKKSRHDTETNNYQTNYHDLMYDRFHDNCRLPKDDTGRPDSIMSLIPSTTKSFNSVVVHCSPHISQKNIEVLCNIIPGMKKCQYTVDAYKGFCKSIITYQDEKAAAYAVDRLNNYVFPSGEILSVKPFDNPLTKAANVLTDIVHNFKPGIDPRKPEFTKLVDAVAEASTLIKVATSSKSQGYPRSELQKLSYCSVELPPPQPLANINSPVALRLFIVSKPKVPSISMLRDVFCRFGDLIDISTFTNRIIGFVKYASVKSALAAMKVLNEATIGGMQLKVVKADEKDNKDENEDVEESGMSNNDTERKRKRLGSE